MKDVKILTDNGINVQQSIELLGDIEMYNETLEDFLSMIGEKLNHLETYKSSDMANYAIDVHSLKSDSRYLGFTTLADLAYESEMKSKAGDINFVQENHPKIIEEAKRVIALAQQYLGKENVDVMANTGDSSQVTASEVQTPVIEPQVQATTAEIQAPAIETQTQVSTIQPQVSAQETTTSTDVMNDALLMSQELAVPVAPVKKGIILVIDDSNLVANFVRKIFSTTYDVMIANDGVSGVNLLSDEKIREKVKACLLDLNMPNMNGFGVMDFLNKNNYFVKIPVAVISGVDDKSSIERANSYPIIDILSKPFNERDIKTVVEKCLAAYF